MKWYLLADNCARSRSALLAPSFPALRLGVPITRLGRRWPAAWLHGREYGKKVDGDAV